MENGRDQVEPQFEPWNLIAVASLVALHFGLPELPESVSAWVRPVLLLTLLLGCFKAASTRGAGIGSRALFAFIAVAGILSAVSAWI